MTSDNYYRCLCNTHVHTGTFVLAIIGTVFTALGSFGIITGGGGWHFFVTSGANIISLICYICLLVGNRKHIPALYLPFLIVNTIMMILLVVLAILMFVSGGMVLGHKTDVKASEEKAVGIALFVFGTLYIIGVLIQFYFYYVIYRGYRYLKDVLLNPSSSVPRIV